MIITSTPGNVMLLPRETPSARRAAEAHAEITALYHQINGRDPNNAAIASWARQLTAGSVI
jgi:hypothetical protein